MKNLKVLYIDTPFIGFNSGDKNRSKFLYESLSKSYKTDICLVKEKNYEKGFAEEYSDLNTNVFTLKSERNSILSPISILGFNNKNLDRFTTIIKKGQYDVCFFRFASMSELAQLVEAVNVNIKVIVDVDMLFSEISNIAWQQNKTFKNRYFLLESLKLNFFERSFFSKNYTYLYTNKNELELVKNKYKIKNTQQHMVLPNVINKMKDDDIKNQEKYILFYGVLNSTANLSAYNFLINKIYPLLKDFLEKENIKIYIVGKNSTNIHLNPLKHIKFIGEVDNLTAYIKNSLLVLFPLTVASGTLTRILEVAYLKKSIVATKKAANGLELEGKIFISEDEKQIVQDIIKVSSDPILKEKFENIAYSFVNQKYSSSVIKEDLNKIVESRKRINVLHIPRRFAKSHWGGTENVILSIANSLNKLGVNSKIVTTNIFSDKNDETISNIKVKRFNYFYPYFNLSKKSKDSLDLVGGNLFSWSLLKYLLFVKDVDLVHLHTAKRLGSIVRTICKIKNIPYVITVHGGVYDISNDEKKERMSPTKGTYEWGKILGFLFGSRKVYHDAKAIITLNSNEFEQTKQVHSSNKVHILPNSVNINQFLISKNNAFRTKYKIAHNDFLFLSSGRIDPQKNQLLILKSFKHLLETKRNIHLLLVGNVTNIDYLKTLESYIEEVEISKNVTIITDLKPNSKELIDSYVNSNAFILASRHEPFGIVAFEALASKLPLIISDICGVCNILKDNQNALFFKDNDVYELYVKMCLLLKDKQLTSHLINNASKEILKYDESIINNNILDIYKKTILEKNNL